MSSGTDSTHRFEVANNLIDGAYPRTNNLLVTPVVASTLAIFLANSFLLVTNSAHDNTVVSTTNYAVIVASGVTTADNYTTNNLLVNDGVEQTSSFGQAVQAWPYADSNWVARDQ